MYVFNYYYVVLKLAADLNNHSIKKKCTRDFKQHNLRGPSFPSLETQAIGKCMSHKSESFYLIRSSLFIKINADFNCFFTEIVKFEVSKAQIDCSGNRVGMMMNIPKFRCDKQIFQSFVHKIKNFLKSKFVLI